jgi:hypothetical protein
MLTPVSALNFLYRLLGAGLLGSIVGLERQWRQRMAGTRTNALVAAGASAFVMAGSLLVDDPSARGRIASYVVSGVGFLGAGVIFKDGSKVGKHPKPRIYLTPRRERWRKKDYGNSTLTNLKDLYNAENQLVKALPKMAKAAASESCAPASFAVV